MNSMSGAGIAPGELLRQIAAFPKRVQNKILELYYPLTESALRALNQAKRAGLGNLITNQGYVYNALRLENPFGDRPMEISVREFALKWEMPLSSCYAAFAQLRKMGIIGRMGGLLRIVWIEDPISSSPPLELLSPDTLAEPTPTTQEGSNPSLPLSEAEAKTADKTKTRKALPASLPLHLTDSLIAELEAIKVNLKQKVVLEAINNSTTEQIKGAIEICRGKWNTIHPNAHSKFFGAVLKNQKSNSPQKPKLSQEFTEWYENAIKNNVCVDIDINSLSLTGIEPIVTLIDGSRVCWKEVHNPVRESNSVISSNQKDIDLKIILERVATERKQE